jgi:hypothetical protein
VRCCGGGEPVVVGQDGFEVLPDEQGRGEMDGVEGAQQGVGQAACRFDDGVADGKRVHLAEQLIDPWQPPGSAAQCFLRASICRSTLDTRWTDGPISRSTAGVATSGNTNRSSAEVST